MLQIFASKTTQKQTKKHQIVYKNRQYSVTSQYETQDPDFFTFFTSNFFTSLYISHNCIAMCSDMNLLARKKFENETMHFPSKRGNV